MNLAVLASGSGSNLQAIIDAEKKGSLKSRVKVVISNNSHSGTIVRANREQIAAYHLSSKTHPDPAALDSAILAVLKQYAIDWLVLAGYMKKLGPATLAAYQNRIINIHPALLPAFGGQGMYGMHVHEAVITAGVKQSGVTIHLADGEYDHGAILAQREIAVAAGRTAAGLARQVLTLEHTFYPETIRNFETGVIRVRPDWLIRPVETGAALADSTRVVRTAFQTVADELQLNRRNCPTHPSLLAAEKLPALQRQGVFLAGLFLHNRQIGFIALEQAKDEPALYYAEKLAVLPAYRHRGYGRLLMHYLLDLVKLRGGKKVSLAMIAQQRVLKDFYVSLGFTVRESKRFPQLPFEVCFMERDV